MKEISSISCVFLVTLIVFFSKQMPQALKQSSVYADRLWRPVSFLSKQLHGPQKRYSTQELEGLALYTSINHFTCYLYGRRFRVVTADKPLVNLLKEKQRNSRLLYWSLKLCNFHIWYWIQRRCIELWGWLPELILNTEKEYGTMWLTAWVDIEYREGVLNYEADYLSRQYTKEYIEEESSILEKGEM